MSDSPTAGTGADQAGREEMMSALFAQMVIQQANLALMLMGKTTPGYTRHHDTGDSVVVINASKVRLTGKKWDDKKYHYHTNFPGGIKEYSAKDLLSKHPEWLVEWAVHGMLPTGHMGRQWRKKLKIFAGADHDHIAQKPEKVTLPHTGQYFE